VRAVWKVKVVDWIHLGPLGFHSEAIQQFAGNRLAVAQQRIKVARRIELEILP
jgi:hypothetical protein